MNKTIIRFRFIKPCGILVGEGSYSPKIVTKYKNVPGVTGRFPYVDYDLDEEFTVELPSERPRKVPAYLESDEFGADARASYVAEQMKNISLIHEQNNLVRDAISAYEAKGIIKKTYDSLFDEVVTKKKVAAPVVPASVPEDTTDETSSASTDSEEPVSTPKTKNRK